MVQSDIVRIKTNSIKMDEVAGVTYFISMEEMNWLHVQVIKYAGNK